MSVWLDRSILPPSFVGGASGRMGEVERRRLEPFETVFVVISLLWLMNTFANLLAVSNNREGGSREAGNILLELINLSLYGSGLVFLFRSLPRALPGLVMRAWPLLALIGLTMVSVLWSDSPETSARRSIGLMLTTSLAFYIAPSVKLRRFLTLLLCAIVLYIGFGILAVAVPGQGITPDGPLVGSWRGFTGIKNEFGRILAVSLAYFVVFGVIGSTWWRRVWIPGAAVSFVLLVLSQSKTSLVVAVAAVCGAFLFRALFQARLGGLRVGPDVRTLAGVGVVVGLLLGAFVLLPVIAEALGRDITLSGRTRLWAWAIDLNLDRAWLGHGYRSFWIDANTKYFFEFFYWNGSLDGGKSDSFAGPANGHNGYLDVWLEMGYVGHAFLGVFLLAALLRVRAAFVSGDMIAGYALATVLSFLLVYSITERVILQQSEAVWFCTMLFYLYADPQLRGATEVRDEHI